MNAAELQIHITAKDSASGTLKDIDKHAGGLGKTLGDVGKIAGGVALGYGIMQAPGFLMAAAQAAADDAASVAKLQQAVENSGAVWETYRGQLEGVVETAQKRGFTDDEARDALSLLTAQTDSADEATRRFAMAQDLARGANIDVYTASKLLGKVTEENVNVLARYGIKAREGMTETELFGMIQAKFGGQAEVFANSTAGQMAAAKIQMGELKEELGYALMPVLTKIMRVLVDQVIPAIREYLPQAIDAAKKAFADAKEAAQPFIDALEGPLKNALAFIVDHKEMVVGALAAVGAVIAVAVVPAVIAWAVAMIAATWPILAVVAAGALLALGIKVLIDHWDQIKAAIMRFWEYVEPVAKVMAVVLLAPFLPLIAAIVLTVKHFDDIKAAAETVFGAIQTTISEKLGFIGAIVGFVWEVIKTIFVANLQAIWATVSFVFEEIKIIVSTVLGVLAGIFDFGLAILKGDWAGAWDALKGIVDTFKTGVEDTVKNLLGFLATLGTLMLGVIGDLASLLYDTGKAIIQGLWNGMKDVWEKAKDWVGGIAGDIKDKIGGLLKIGSPSQVMFEMGASITEGLRLGMLAGQKSLSFAAPQMAEAIAGGGSALTGGKANTYNTSNVGRQGSNFYGPVTVQVSGGGDILAEIERQLR